MTATMQTIADDLGLSVMTVSLALNGKGKISQATRQRVIDAAARLGYRPNVAARATATGRFNNIALLLSADIATDHLPSDLLYGIQQTLEQRQMRVSLAHMSDQQLTDDQHLPSILSQISADGLIVNYKTNVPPRLMQLLDRFAIPAVWIDADRRTDSVRHDHQGAARIAVERLLALGHTRIAFADNHPAKPGRNGPRPHFSLQARRESYRQAMLEAGREPWFIHRGDDEPDKHDRRAWARTWLDLPPRRRPTAVIAYVMGSAVPIYLAATGLGLRVPDDLALVTFADASEARILPLTHVRLDVFAMGRQAVQMLLHKIEQPAAAHPTQVLPGQWVAGFSTAP
jgi:LacI family transcriptional regulator